MVLADLLVLLKIRLGITSSARDSVLNHNLNSTIKMLDDEKDILLDLDNPLMTEFIIEYGVWKYESKGEQSGIPRHLQFALHNLIIHNQRPEVVD